MKRFVIGARHIVIFSVAAALVALFSKCGKNVSVGSDAGLHAPIDAGVPKIATEAGVPVLLEGERFGGTACTPGTGTGQAQDATAQCIAAAYGLSIPVGGTGTGLCQDATLKAILGALGDGGTSTPATPFPNAIIYKPGVASAGPNVETWPEVQTAINATNGAITVYLDCQIAPCTVPASSGTTNMLGATTIQSYNLLARTGGVTQQSLTINDGAILNRPKAFVNCDIFCADTTTSCLSFNTTVNPTDSLFMNNADLALNAGATVPAVVIGASGQLNLYSSFNTTYDSSLAGAVPVIQLGTSAELSWTAYGGVNLLGTNTINGGGAGATIVFTHDDLSGLQNFTGFGFTGTVTEFRASNANEAQPAQGNTASRPVAPNVFTGQIYFDTTLNQLIVWNGSAWVIPSTGTSEVIRIAITNAASQSSTTSIPSGSVVLRAFLDIVTPYSAGATITLGTTASAALFMAAGDSNPQIANLYDAPQDTVNSVSDPLLVTVAGAPAAGAGFAFVEYATPLN
jgi:hypothetical protein